MGNTGINGSCNNFFIRSHSVKTIIFTEISTTIFTRKPLNLVPILRFFKSLLYDLFTLAEPARFIHMG